MLSAVENAPARKLGKYLLLVLSIVSALAANASATQADNTTITIRGDTAGATPFIRFVHLTASNVNALRSVRFSIAPKAGSLTRPLSATYPLGYLDKRSYVSRKAGDVVVPLFGLYSASVNDVTLTFTFFDGSSQTAAINVATEPYTDACGLDQLDVIQAREPNAPLSYDFIMVENQCGPATPIVLDLDGQIRWVGTAGGGSYSVTNYNNEFYFAPGPHIFRIEYDGTFTELGDYPSLNYVGFHHTIDRGKRGLLYQVSTTSDFESTIVEIDREGQVLKTWDLAQILRAVMEADGDDPSTFIKPGQDWFHSNATTYRASDDSLLVSSRENFVIALDYESGAIKWILGDLTKHWADFPSLRKFALSVPSGNAPIGQHALSFTTDDQLMLFDNGTASLGQTPAGAMRDYSAGRKYALDLNARTATETWTHDNNQQFYSNYCSSIYQDGDQSYLLDYSRIINLGSTIYAELVGLTASGEKAFEYRYPAQACELFNSAPLHWENVVFPEAAGALVNVSGRALTAQGDNVSIGGFIIGGSSPKKVVIRGLGPSLTAAGLKHALPDPVLELHDASTLLATNDDYVASAELTDSGLTPGNPRESAIVMSLNPGNYTAVLRGKSASGVGLIEVYDVEANSTQVVNVSTRARLAGGDNVLIAGFIVDHAPIKVLVRALGPSLQAAGIQTPLQNPRVLLFDANGAAVAENKDWKETQQPEIEASGLAPGDDREAAVITTLGPGNYTAVVMSQEVSAVSNGIGLVEVFDLASTANFATKTSRD